MPTTRSGTVGYPSTEPRIPRSRFHTYLDFVNHSTADCDRHSHQATGERKAERGNSPHSQPEANSGIGTGSWILGVSSSTAEKHELVGLNRKRTHKRAETWFSVPLCSDRFVHLFKSKSTLSSRVPICQEKGEPITLRLSASAKALAQLYHGSLAGRGNDLQASTPVPRPIHALSRTLFPDTPLQDTGRVKSENAGIYA